VGSIPIIDLVNVAQLAERQSKKRDLIKGDTANKIKISSKIEKNN